MGTEYRITGSLCPPKEPSVHSRIIFDCFPSPIRQRIKVQFRLYTGPCTMPTCTSISPAHEVTRGFITHLTIRHSRKPPQDLTIRWRGEKRKNAHRRQLHPEICKIYQFIGDRDTPSNYHYTHTHRLILTTLLGQSLVHSCKESTPRHYSSIL